MGGAGIWLRDSWAPANNGERPVVIAEKMDGMCLRWAEILQTLLIREKMDKMETEAGQARYYLGLECGCNENT